MNAQDKIQWCYDSIRNTVVVYLHSGNVWNQAVSLWALLNKCSTRWILESISLFHMIVTTKMSAYVMGFSWGTFSKRVHQVRVFCTESCWTSWNLFVERRFGPDFEIFHKLVGFNSRQTQTLFLFPLNNLPSCFSIRHDHASVSLWSSTFKFWQLRLESCNSGTAKQCPKCLMSLPSVLLSKPQHLGACKCPPLFKYCY